VKPRVIDTHCHLTDRRLVRQADGVLASAAEAGVVAVVSAGSSVADSAAAADLARDREGVYFTAGVQPHDAKEAQPDYLDRIERLAGEPKCVAVGEIGLDYHHDLSPRDVQRRVFAEQLALARQLGKPAVVHTREALDDTLAILAESGLDGRRVVFHSFTGPPEQTRRVLAIGARVSFSGIVTFAGSDGVRASAGLVPDDRLLIETDAPYLSPEPVRKERPNTPAQVVHVAACLAAVRGDDPTALAERTTANAAGFFGLDIAP